MLQVKEGAYNEGMKRFASYQIPNSGSDVILAADGLVSKGAAKKVSKWLQRATAQEQDAFRKLAASIKQRAKRSAQRNMRERAPGEEKIGRQRSVDGRAHEQHDHWQAEDDRLRDQSGEVDITFFPPAPHDGAGAEQPRPRFRAQFDGTRVSGGQRADDALGAGAVQWVKRELQEHVHARARGVRDAWRWMDPGLCGRLDVAALRNLLAELDIPCDAQTARALFEALDVDGDGLLGFEDFCACLNDAALEERDFFAVSRRPGAMLANEPVVFGPPPLPDGAEPDAALGRSAPPRLATSLTGGPFGPAAQPRPPTREPGAPSAQLGHRAPDPAAAEAGRSAGALGALVESRRALTSNFRATSPKPLRAAAFMPTRYPMRRAPAPEGLSAWREAAASGEPAVGEGRDVLALNEGPGRLATSTGLVYKSAPLWAGPGRSVPESTQQASLRRAATPGPSTERPADIFFMRPRTSMAGHKAAVLQERGSNRTWE
jgi:hypothetical protein